MSREEVPEFEHLPRDKEGVTAAEEEPKPLKEDDGVTTRSPWTRPVKVVTVEGPNTSRTLSGLCLVQ